jgi:hypothetical protein
VRKRNEDLAAAREMRDFALKAFARFAHQANYRTEHGGNKAGRDQATERAINASIAFFLANAQIEQLTGQPGHVAAPAPSPASK